MVYKKSEIKNIIFDFVKKAQGTLPIKQVIIFGSYAYGRPRGKSDLDMAVVSSKFKKIKDIKRIMLLSNLARKIETPHLIDINPIGFTEEELSNADYFELAGEIKDKGVVVYSAEE